jgi:serine phosphatase RsbU (regulator of sigma subunit)
VRNVAFVTCAYFGLALAGHADHYFPRERPDMVARRWGRWLPYATAAGSTLAVMVTASTWNRGPVGNPNLTFLAGLLATLLAVQFVSWRGRGERTAEDKVMTRPLRWAKLSVPVVAATLISGAAILGKVRDWAYYVFLLLVLVPAAYTYIIAKYRLLDLDLRVRRSVQYSVASVGWAGLSVLALLWVLSYLPSLQLPVPNIQVSSSSVELLDQPATEAHRLALEKGVLMIAAIGLAFLFRAVGRGGQHWIASRFHRTAYDYRRASRELADVMGTRLDLDGLAEGLVGTLVGLMPLKRAGVVFVHGTRRYCGSRAPGFEPEAWSRLCGETAGQIVRLAETTSSEVTVEYLAEPLRSRLRGIGVHYLFPIRSHDALVGVILLGEKRSESAYVDDDFQFLGAVAQQASAGVENAFLYEDLAEQERLRHELDIARRIQLESLPQFTPSVEGLEVAGSSVPAFEVGGDYFDYLNGDPRQLTVMVGDVSGKGTSAALYMSKLQGIVRSLHAFRLTPREMFVRTNDLLGRDLERRAFVTALGAFFNAGDRRLVLARAGHLPLYHWDSRSGEVRRELPRGLGFGLSNRPVFDEELEEREIRYAPGDVFLFITDGITECLATEGEDFGEARVMSLLREQASAGQSAADLRDHLLGAVRRFAGGADQFDDQTVVVVRATA